MRGVRGVRGAWGRGMNPAEAIVEATLELAVRGAVGGGEIFKGRRTESSR